MWCVDHTTRATFLPHASTGFPASLSSWFCHVHFCPCWAGAFRTKLHTPYVPASERRSY